jgi:outer membrane biosynthesis protein TonB
VQVATNPRLSGGIAASMILHAGLIAAFFLVRPGAPPPEAPTIAVRLIAAPPGEPAAGVVQQPPTATPATPPPAPAAVVKREVVKTRVPTTKPKPVPRLATPTTKRAAEPSTPATPQPTAGGGLAGGKGADVANVTTGGIEFPYPYYTTNIVSKLIQRFGPMAGTLSAAVRFVIRRDGSVDPESIQLVSRSGNYSFDLRAVGAVESAANAREFGPLPPGFREDVLPVTMRFSPTIIK